VVVLLGDNSLYNLQALWLPALTMNQCLGELVPRVQKDDSTGCAGAVQHLQAKRGNTSLMMMVTRNTRYGRWGW